MRIVNVMVAGQPVLAYEDQGTLYYPDAAWAAEKEIPRTVDEVFAREDVWAFLQEMRSALDFGAAGVSGGIGPSHWTAISADTATYDVPVPRGKKIICVGLNYRKHAAEADLELPTTPILFSKFDNSLIGHQHTVPRPAYTEKLDYEGEVAVVIGKVAKDVAKEDALDYVLGYTLANDLTARDMQFLTSQWLLGKTGDGFCPLGPTVVTADEITNPNDMQLQCLVNGEVRQDASTEAMIFSFADLVSYASSHFTLYPGDIILSGTPEGVILGRTGSSQVWLSVGDEVTVRVEELGELTVTIG